MIAYHALEYLVVLALLGFSLRQVLKTMPNVALHLGRALQRVGLPAWLAAWIAPAVKAAGCSACDSCSGCGPRGEGQAHVITLHRNMNKD